MDKPKTKRKKTIDNRFEYRYNECEIDEKKIDATGFIKRSGSGASPEETAFDRTL